MRPAILSDGLSRHEAPQSVVDSIDPWQFVVRLENSSKVALIDIDTGSIRAASYED
jgi:hypothetical protein